MTDRGSNSTKHLLQYQYSFSFVSSTQALWNLVSPVCSYKSVRTSAREPRSDQREGRRSARTVQHLTQRHDGHIAAEIGVGVLGLFRHRVAAIQRAVQRVFGRLFGRAVGATVVRLLLRLRNGV